MKVLAKKHKEYIVRVSNMVGKSDKFFAFLGKSDKFFVYERTKVFIFALRIYPFHLIL